MEFLADAVRRNGTSMNSTPQQIFLGLAGGIPSAIGTTYEGTAPMWGIATGSVAYGDPAVSLATGKDAFYGMSSGSSWKGLTGSTVSLDTIFSQLYAWSSTWFYGGKRDITYVDVMKPGEIDLGSEVDGAFVGLRDTGGTPTMTHVARFYNNENWETTAHIPAVRLVTSVLGFAVDGSIVQLAHRDAGCSQLVIDGYDSDHLANSAPFDVDGTVTARITTALLTQYPVVRFVSSLILGGAGMYPRALRDATAALLTSIGLFATTVMNVNFYDLREGLSAQNDTLIVSGIPTANLA